MDVTETETETDKDYTNKMDMNAINSKKNILEILGVRQVFRDGFWMKKIEILHGLDLSVPEGSIFGFVGPNGAGKTTLIQLIVGLRNPTKGKVLLLGHEASTKEGRALLGYLPERPYFYSHLTGEQTLRYFGALSGLSTREINIRIPEVLRMVGLAEFRKLKLDKFSKGMLQRIGIAQALIHEPKMLVLDEPMSGLDPIGRKEVKDLIRKLGQEGRTVFFSTHIIPDVEDVCTHAALIQKGRIAISGPLEQIRRSGSLESLFGGDFSGVSKGGART